MSKPKVYVGLPTYKGQADAETVVQFTLGALTDAAEVVWGKSQSAFLPHSFNELWANALNRRLHDGATHFAMLHADVVPEPGWLGRLLSLLAMHDDADVVSAVIPLKEDTGLTSTGYDEPPGGRRRPQMLTLREVWTGPSTFTAADAGYTDKALLINTGCWVCKLGDWSEEIAFQAHTMIRRNDRGDFLALTYPEDWDFSLQLHRLGRKYLATRLVPLYHGLPQWTNRYAWGSEWNSGSPPGW